VDDWRTGHPIVFPTTLRSNNGQGHPNMQIRVPLDDTHTRYYTYQVYPCEGARPREEVPVYELPYRSADGRLIMDKVLNQDMSIWITQGAISDRTFPGAGPEPVRGGCVVIESAVRHHSSAAPSRRGRGTI
jgi:5,5'-dehydrodivanillate O-demethylase